ncbi:MAG: sulfatase-like hydrolase/transferase [Pirellulaceae bacterium]|nr:sulfatase-like hydrolase/transferase [Pirellulaceae bacterium]
MWSRSEVWDYANEQADELGLDVLRFATTFWCDMQFGALIDALKMKGVYDDTLVILQSDHGQIAKGLVPMHFCSLMALDESAEFREYIQF